MKKISKIKESGIDWIGDIPNHWDVKVLGLEAKVKARLGWKGLKASEYVDEGYIFLATPNIKGTSIDFQNVNYIAEERYLESPEIMLRENDVLMAKDGSTLGIINVVRDLPKPATVNSSIAVIRSNAKFDSVFLYYFFSSSFIQNLIGLLKDGMGVPHLFQADIRKFPLLCPPIEEQKIIAQFLDRKTTTIDTLITKKKRLIELLEEKRSALINQAVTKGVGRSVRMKDSGVSWIGEIPKHWEVCELRRAWTVIDCKHKTPEYLDDGYPLVSTTEVKPGKIDLSIVTRFISEDNFHDMTENRLPCKGDIIYSRNASLGSAAYVDTDQRFAMGQDVVLITSEKQDQLFLSYFLNAQTGISQVDLACVGSTFRRINVGQIKQILVTVPPLEEQIAIGEYLEKIHGFYSKNVALIYLQIEKLQEYRQSLITAAVTGKLAIPAEEAT
jgi:type I restriction enzyme, S subunit